MVLTITQQTFDEAVQENINDLGLAPEEAVTEAVIQFKSQGVDLSHIMISLSGAADYDNLKKIIDELKSLKDKKDVSKECEEQLKLLKEENDKGIEFRVQAGRFGAYDLVLDLFLANENLIDLKIACLKALLSLTIKHPDILDERGQQLILANLDSSANADLLKWTLKWCRESCVMHEINRQQLFEADILKPLKKILNDSNTSNLKDTLAVLRVLVLDDDIRVEFGKAHEHAKIIAVETLPQLSKLLENFKNNEEMVNDLLLTLTALLVRAEFCKSVEQAGVLELIQEIMLNFLPNDKIHRQSFKLLKALAGNDEVKASIVQKGLGGVISESLSIHIENPQTSAAGLGCVAALSLRNVDNSKVLFEVSLPETIIETMKRHPNDKSVQKSGSWAIRNMVSRSRHQNQRFLELGVEDLLKSSLAKFKDCEYDIKAALRDLECDIDFKEEWTGKGGFLTSGMVKND